MASIDKLAIRMSVGVQGALFLLAQEAQQCGDEHGAEIAAAASRCAQRFGSTKMAVRIPAAQLFASACDSMRAAGEHEAVAALEDLVALIKRGQKPRRVLGTIALGVTSVGEIDEALERVRKTAIRNAGG